MDPGFGRRKGLDPVQREQYVFLLFAAKGTFQNVLNIILYSLFPTSRIDKVFEMPANSPRVFRDFLHVLTLSTSAIDAGGVFVCLHKVMLRILVGPKICASIAYAKFTNIIDMKTLRDM